MKYCKKCNQEKTYIEFGANRRTKDGLSYFCKKCLNKISSTHREKDNAYAKEYREKNKEKLKLKRYVKLQKIFMSEEIDVLKYFMASEKVQNLIYTMENCLEFFREYDIKPDDEVKKALNPRIEILRKWLNES